MLPEEGRAALLQAGLDDVSRETEERLLIYIELLAQWNRTHNLVGPSALAQIWSRHVGDSAQLRVLAPRARRWLDIGSGAGFPGLVMGALLAGTPDAEIHLVETISRKVAFLRAAARAMDAPVVVHQERAEILASTWNAPIDAISARALAPMATLISWTLPLLEKGIPAYLHKGLDFPAEWDAVAHRDRFNLIQHRNRFGAGVVIELRTPPNHPED